MKSILLVIFIFILSCMESFGQSKEYIIIEIEKFHKLIREKDAEYLYQDSLNFSQIYKFKDGKMGLIPAVGNKCILFDSEKAFIDNTKDGIPIEEENPNEFQKNVLLIADIENNTSLILTELEREINFKIDLDDESEEYYIKFSKALNEFKTNNVYERLFLPLTVFIGEKINRKYKGSRWVLDKKYGYNPYYEPFILNVDGTIYYPWYKLSANLLNKKKIDIKKIIELGFTRF